MLKFKDNSFDFVVRTEVLEHLDNFHDMVDELFRVSSKHVLISLPNCVDSYGILNWVINRRSARFYGLPLKKPADRHKWFFSWEEARIFFAGYCHNNKYEIMDDFLVSHFKPKLVNVLIKNLHLNFMSNSYWVLVSK